MSNIINGYFISCRIGADEAEVRQCKAGKFGRTDLGALVFRGTWEDCQEYARAH